MLRKRARSIQKAQQITTDGDVGSDLYIYSDISLQKQKITPFFNAPNSLFIGLTCMGVPDCDSLRSPTSPLDFKLFSTSNSTRFPKPSLDGHNKCWVCSKVGLGSIVDSLDDAEYHHCDNNHHVNDDGVADEDDGKFCVKSNILFGSQVRGKTSNSLTNGIVCEAPKTLSHKGSSDVLFEIRGNTFGYDSIGKIRSFSFDSKSLVSEICRLGAFDDSDIRTNASCSKLTTDQVDYGLGHTLDPSEIEQSEDYTCVISHGPNPKTTHIFGDCVLGCHTNGIQCENKKGNPENGTSCLEIPSPLPPTCLLTDFLSHCNYCKNKLEEGKDIYMYRGEKAFCSWDCRLEGISIEEQKEHSMSKSHREHVESKTKDRNFDKSIFVAI